MAPKAEQNGSGEPMIQMPRVVQERAPVSMTLGAAAKELQIHKSTLEALIKAGAIRCHQLSPGGDRRVSYNELVRFVEARENEGIRR